MKKSKARNRYGAVMDGMAAVVSRELGGGLRVVSRHCGRGGSCVYSQRVD